MGVKMADALDEIIAKPGALRETLATCHPNLARGIVWCHKCGAMQRVNVAKCFGRGWPVHCGETMSIDSPDERAALKARRA